MIRPQYYFLDSSEGLLAWDVRRLIQLSSTFEVDSTAVKDIAELHENHWFRRNSPTCLSLLEHMRLIEDADLSFPIILSANGRVMDGMHRVCKAHQLGFQTILYVQFSTDPEPDFVNRQPDDLPY